MALFDIFKRKRRSQERIENITKKSDSGQEKKEKKEKKEALKKVSNFARLTPYITEKSTFLNEKGAYVFRVGGKTNKILIKKAIEEMYNVSPVKINITNLPDKRIFSRRTGKYGRKAGVKKAIVYLKKGEKIEIA